MTPDHIPGKKNGLISYTAAKTWNLARSSRSLKEAESKWCFQGRPTLYCVL